jgi:hypothetical protein
MEFSLFSSFGNNAAAAASMIKKSEQVILAQLPDAGLPYTFLLHQS